jgi:arylsulfatase A-like enzyme
VSEGVVEKFPDARAEIFVIWTQVLETDNFEGAERAAQLFEDPRVHQFHDPDLLIGRAFADTIHMPSTREVCRASNDEISSYEGILDPNVITGPAAVFDTVFFIPPGETWPSEDRKEGTARSPAPTSWVTQLDPEIYVGVDAERFRFGEPMLEELTRLAALSFSAAEAKAVRPNVLLIIADDLRTELGCYGDTAGLTPHIDGLAARGTVFTRAYAQAPDSLPSRVSLLSGLRPRTTGIFENDSWPKLDLLTLPEHFASNGYGTFKIGMVLQNNRQARLGRQARGAEGSDRRIWTKTLQPLPARRSKKTQEPRADPRDEWKRGPTASIHSRSEGADFLDDHDGRVAEATARFLKEERQEPFFLAVGFNKPHLPFHAPQPYFERVRDLGIDPPPVPADALDGIHETALAGVRSFEILEPKERREAVRAYRACVAFLDDCVGRVLAALEEGGHGENTIVCFVSDHGQLLGEHNLWRDGVLFEETTRVPFLVFVPDAVGESFVRGSCSRLIELVDLYPTLAELCGLPIPADLEGISLVALLKDPERPWKRGVFSAVRRGESLVTDQWRFTRWEDGALELYNHANDPEEHTNLWDSSGHGEILNELSVEMGRGWEGCLPESIR